MKGTQSDRSRFLEAALASSADGVMIVDADGRTVYVNEAIRAILGRLPAEDQPVHAQAEAFGLRYPDGRPIPPEELPISRALKGETIKDLPLIFRRPGGTDVWVSSTVSPVFDSRGKIIGATSILRDVTEQRRAEIELEKSEAWLRLAQQAGHVGTFEWNIETGAIQWTPELEALYGLPPGGFSGTLEAWEAMLHPDDRPAVGRRVQQALGGGTLEDEWRVVWPDGSVHWIAGRSWVIHDASGKPIRAIGVNIDITERKHAEEALRESERRYRTLFDNVSLRVFGKDRNSVYLTANPGFARDRGLPPEEVVGKTDYDLFPRDVAEKYRADDRRVMAAGTTDEFDERYTTHGEERAVHTLKAPVRSSDGAIIGVLGFFWDVTERVRAEDALRESEKRFRATFEQAAVGIAHVAVTDGRFLRINQKLCDIVGYTHEEMLARTFQEITYAEDLEADLALSARLVTGEISTYTLEKRYVRKDGYPVWLGLTASLVRDSSGAPDYYIDVVEDISERKAVEAERQRLLEEQVEARRRIEDLAVTAQRRAAELRSVLDTMVEAVIVVNAERRIALVNGAFTQMTGLSAQEIVGVGLGEYAEALKLRTPEGREKVAEELTMTRAMAGQTVTNEPAVVRSKRTQRDVQLRVSTAPLRGSDGRINGAVVVARDVTELTELDRLKDQFIAVTAHELKTPITIMKGYAQTLLLTGGDLPQPRRRMLEAISRGTDRIDRIIVDLLDISRLMVGQLELTLGPVDLSQLAEEVVDRTSMMAPKHAIRITRVKPVVVQGDRHRLEQVLVNLLDNAVRYSPAGGEIDVSVDASSDEAVVSVADHGVGIPAEKQGRVFQRFYRAHTGTPYDYGGMGVGLYISHEIVARHGGRTWFESQEGRGSTFHFGLPLTGWQKQAGRRREGGHGD